ncbi:MAG TPA: 50S ribosomal protein L9 [Rhodobacteraceae bacterium]|nr:50S ribosomal protein L9 [Amylibacter sp.]MDG1234843.1 50S ribosomal protein L9 [Amylibacter sp.]MDG1999590.1 50S ribosomal protein L9 [Amylibacter sp.]HAD27434.1 50S ribosomal protein L9 [Paracoccaceae bacterium]|tara:strand:+ start:904 stop:1545 length:642 start_codon:yes stop_codon:yes gene_type:complete
MDVILLERVAKLGQMGDVVSVKQGYARNFLLPLGKALRATKGNMESFEHRKSQLEVQNLETKKEAEAVATKLDGQQFIVIRSASDAGSLYGSVTNRDAAEAATEAGYSVDKKQLVLEAPIKELGVHNMIVRLHPEVECTIEVNVARSAEEAELQASGKSIQELAAEAEAEAEFEIAELFDDIGSAALDDLEESVPSSNGEQSSDESEAGDSIA